jgi:hypothetical protein
MLAARGRTGAADEIQRVHASSGRSRARAAPSKAQRSGICRRSSARARSRIRCVARGFGRGRRRSDARRASLAHRDS